MRTLWSVLLAGAAMITPVAPPPTRTTPTTIVVVIVPASTPVGTPLPSVGFGCLACRPPAPPQGTGDP